MKRFLLGTEFYTEMSLVDLPNEILWEVVEFLPFQAIGSFVLTHRKLNRVVGDEFVKRKLLVKFESLAIRTIAIQNLVGSQTLVKYKKVDTIYKIKQRYQDKTGIPPDQQLYIFAGKPL